MIQYIFPVIERQASTKPSFLDHWTWPSHVSKHGNKYEALQEYIAKRASQGVFVAAHDMSQFSHKWL